MPPKSKTEFIENSVLLEYKELYYFLQYDIILHLFMILILIASAHTRFLAGFLSFPRPSVFSASNLINYYQSQA